MAASGELLADADPVDDDQPYRRRRGRRSAARRPEQGLRRPRESRCLDRAGPEVPGAAEDADAEDELDERRPSAGTLRSEFARRLAVVDLREPLTEDPRSTPSLVRALLSAQPRGLRRLRGWRTRRRRRAGAYGRERGRTAACRTATAGGSRPAKVCAASSTATCSAADSWLVTTIASRHKGVIIDRTDVARRPLAGAPLCRPQAPRGGARTRRRPASCSSPATTTRPSASATCSAWPASRRRRRRSSPRRWTPASWHGCSATSATRTIAWRPTASTTESEPSSPSLMTTDRSATPGRLCAGPATRRRRARRRAARRRPDRPARSGPARTACGTPGRSGRGRCGSSRWT